MVYIGEGWRGGGDGASGRVAGEKQKGVAGQLGPFKLFGIRREGADLGSTP